MKLNNIRLLLPVFMFFVLAGALVSCKSASVIPPTTIETVNTTDRTEKLRDTIVVTEKDSSYYKAWLECRDGKVVIKDQPIEAPGRKLKPPKVTIRDNLLKVDCQAEAEKYTLKWKEVFIKEFQSRYKQEPVVISAPFTKWQTTQIWLGRILILLVIVAILRMVGKATKVI